MAEESFYAIGSELIPEAVGRGRKYPSVMWFNSPAQNLTGLSTR
jgi:hypothetical protein